MRKKENKTRAKLYYMIPHPATKQQVMREGEEKAGEGDMEPGQTCGEPALCSPPRPLRAMKTLPYPHFEKCSRSDPFLANSCFPLGLHQAHQSPPASLPTFTPMDAIPIRQTFPAPVPTYGTPLPSSPYPPHPGPRRPGGGVAPVDE